MKRILLLTAALGVATQAQAGGQLDTFRFTGNFAGVFAPNQDVEIVPIVWDDRCTQVNYTINTLNNPVGAGGPIPFASWAPEMQASFDPWNNIPTSYIEMDVTATAAIPGPSPVLTPGLRSFNMINELTWQTPGGSGFLASSPSTSFIRDVNLVPGQLIDGDADADVYDPALATPAGRTDCHDFDGDGDIEFSAGFYPAGTIIENDVQFNNRLAPTIVWELTPTSAVVGPPPGYTVVLPRKTDIQAVAVHEFGHSHGLSHSVINQISGSNGDGATMFPAIDIDDRFTELDQRTLHEDDIAWSSYAYPEGTDPSGYGALQAGDVAFSAKYRLITGSYTRAGIGVLGGNIAASKTNSKETLVSAYSGKARAFSTTGTNVLISLARAADHVRSDQYVIPVPKGTYHLAMQALDGSPALFDQISTTANIGGILGQHNYAEEFRSSNGLEDDLEHIPAQSTPVQVNSGSSAGNDVVTNTTVRLRNAGAITNAFTSAVLGVSDVIYAERFTNAQVLAQLNAGAIMTTGTFHTVPFDASVVSNWKRAGLYLGTLNGDGTANINLAAPIVAETDFIGQDGDGSPYFFPDPAAVSLNVKNQLTANPALEVFLVLEAKNNPVLADDPRPPRLGFQSAAGTGRSYLSVNGGAIAPQATRNWIVELHFTPAN